MSADQTPPPPADAPRNTGRIRSSTVERERTASILRAAAEAGLLTLDEADERMAACYQSQFQDELAPLLTDLPHGGRKLIPPDPEEEARDRRADRDSLGGHIGFVVVVGAVLVGIWAISGAGFFWPAWPLGFLALTLVFHAKHRKRRQAWRRMMESGDFSGLREFRDFHGHGHHGCGPRGRQWGESHTSRSW